ncbi:hypothetical protein J7I44_16155 [Frateuria sp. MAH-13]|uniref:Alpha/beta hydrolase n=1 Tax=Frateuria flava TaxID=2821489 RepID=A0ABS4DS00_9GAMM|nr:hypothetical protein [Frateuria flava]MBP1475834.1 hypothetical protein [Frateuria flava]
MRLHPSAVFGPLVALLLAACSAGGDITRPIPTRWVSATQPPHRLVVMLPGRGDDLQSLGTRGIAQTIQQHWPDTDVVLTGLTMPFYREGRAAERLHEEVIVPARRRHYDQIWLVGISLGGMGALLYDRSFPGDIDGMLLISPYLGDKAIYREIQAAGGLDRWRPGPVETISEANYQRELWRYIQHWSETPERTASIWVAYGDKERFRDRIALLATQLPPGHAFELPGHHNWTLWQPAATTLLEHARPEAGSPEAARPDADQGKTRTGS